MTGTDHDEPGGLILTSKNAEMYPLASRDTQLYDTSSHQKLEHSNVMESMVTIEVGFVYFVDLCVKSLRYCIDLQPDAYSVQKDIGGVSARTSLVHSS